MKKKTAGFINKRLAATISFSRNINKKFWEAQMKQNSWIKNLVCFLKLCDVNVTKTPDRELSYCDISNKFIMAFNHHDFVIKH